MQQVNITRRMLGEFIKSPETLRAFENLGQNSDELSAAVTAIKAASVLTLSSSDAFANGRVLQAGAGLALTDGGAGGNLSVGIENTAVSAGGYGSATRTVSFSVNARGQITAAQEYNLVTDNITEGGSKLFFTDARARTAANAAGARYVPVSAGSGTQFVNSPIYVDADGRVLIGTTAVASSNFEREFKTSTSGAWPLALNAVDRGLLVRNSSAASGFYAYFEYNGGTNNGSISWSGATTSYNTSSDYRLKENLVPLAGSGEFIDALKCYSGAWKADGLPFVGMIAHEVQEVVSTPVVIGQKDGHMMQAMDYSSPEIIANIITELQSLRTRVAALEAAGKD